MVQRSFHHSISEFPCSYLSIPLSIHKLLKVTLQPLVDKVSHHLPPWKGQLTTLVGRSVLVQSVLSTIPVHVSMAIGLPGWVVKAIDKKRCAFLWLGTDSVQGGRCLVSWTNVCRPKVVEGLGIADLRMAGFALRLRWLWLPRLGHPYWADLKASHEHSITDMFAASTYLVPGDGMSALFWLDQWIEGCSVASLAMNLLLVVPTLLRATRTVASALVDNSWVRDIVTP